MAKFTPQVATIARAARAKMRKLIPGAVELVYDNYNALAIGFGPTERSSDVVISIAVYPRWVSVFLMQGARLPDPEGLLQGEGKRVRHIVLESAATLDKPAVRALLKSAVARGGTHFPSGARRRTIIKSVSAKQRPRRPARKA